VSRFLVTGGAGFIGSHLVDALLARGAAVRIVDNFVTGRQANLPSGGRFDLLVGDLAEDGVAARAVEGCEFVLHLAAIPSVPRSVADPLPSHRANVDATLQLLLAARDAGVSRLVFAGSSSVYGDSPTLPKREDQRPGPLSPYALQKLVSEQYCSLFTRLYGLDTVTTRFFNVFGPRQDPGSPYSGVISLFIDAVLEDRRPTIYGDGHQTRDFTYVEDVVTGVLQCCEATGIAGEVLNIAGGGRVSLLEVLDTLADLTDRPIDPIFMPPREGDIRDSQADIARARGLVGFEPSVPFREGLRRTLEWHRQSAVAPPSH
jgi:nucleoside-diphosphate-sugar epimerase